METAAGLVMEVAGSAGEAVTAVTRAMGARKEESLVGEVGLVGSTGLAVARGAQGGRRTLSQCERGKSHRGSCKRRQLWRPAILLLLHPEKLHRRLSCSSQGFHARREWRTHVPYIAAAEDADGGSS